MSGSNDDRAAVTRRGFLAGGLGLAGATLLPRPPSAASAEAGGGGLDFASAIAAARAIGSRQVSSVEITRRMLDRIDRYNPALNAVVNVLREPALARAREADAALAKGERWGALHGVPVAVKDAFEIEGVPTTAGAEFLAKHVPARDSDAVARLRAAGAVVLGNTNVPFMLGDWQSYNAIHGTTNNPWDKARTPGGSSGGSAAALAAGLAYLALGSDIGGSIRVPAHFCGVYGHKPTLNVVSQRGHIPPPPGTPPQPPTDLPVAGPMARSAEDLEAAMRILGGPDEEEAVAYRWSLPPARHERFSDYRLGFVLDDPLCPVSSDVKDVLAGAIEKLRKAGLRLEEGWPPEVKPRPQYETYRYLLSAFFAFELKDEEIEAVRARAAKADGSLETLVARATVDPHKHFQAASSRRMEARAAWQQYFRTHDAFLMPTSFVAAFPHDHSVPQTARRVSTAEGPRPYM
ncbi:MAG TPA: amidase family protein, partial [Vicinamibacteria bacterium]|nr:amidase family protein [Vicinamibacteria bacterium]